MYFRRWRVASIITGVLSIAVINFFEKTTGPAEQVGVGSHQFVIFSIAIITYRYIRVDTVHIFIILQFYTYKTELIRTYNLNNKKLIIEIIKPNKIHNVIY